MCDPNLWDHFFRITLLIPPLIYTDNNTALLLFSHTAGQESLHKTFLNRHIKKCNKRIAQALIDRSTRIALQTKLPFFLFDEQLQRGTCFGERLANAMDDVFEKGFEKIIVIGNDCPSLSADLISKAAVEIKKNDVLLAPTAKGGVYLLGISRQLFEKSLFERINWQTSTVFENMIQYAEEKSSSTFFFPCLNDINSYTDLVTSLSYLSYIDAFRVFVTGIIASFLNFIPNTFTPLNLQPALVQESLRGPPVF